MSRTFFSANLAQDTREQAMHQAGIDRYRDKQDRLTAAGTASERDDFATIIRRSLLGVAERVSKLIEENSTKGRPNTTVLKIASVDAVTLAYFALASAFSTLTKDDGKNKIATKIGQIIEDEVNFRFIHQQAPKLWERLQRYADEHGTYRHKRSYVLNTAEREGLPREVWSIEDRTLIGSILLNLIEEAGLIKTVSETDAQKKTHTRVELTEPVLAWLEEHRKKADSGSLPMITPIYSPMTELPLDWAAPTGGGYKHIKYPLVKHGHAKYGEATMPAVYQSINLMQRTAWRINARMLALVEMLWATGAEVGKLPACVRLPVPERVPQEDWEQMAPDERKGHRIQLREVHDNNRRAASNLISINQVLAQARELKSEPAIYIPYQLDYRGRVYAMPLMNPQGPDHIRSLFEFSNGKPVGERGALWIALQVASLWDGPEKLSKASFQDRYEWVENNEEMLRSIAADPLTDTRWQHADKPFMFLRSSIEWVEVLDAGYGFVSSLPIALDGSCSGIQHYSALLRDPVGGASVNLLPSDTPADVYSDVANAVRAEVEVDAPSPERDFWLYHGITRKVVKKPVMTYGYSSREAGFTDWYEAEFVRPTFRKEQRQDATGPYARYLAKVTLSAVEQRLIAVAQGMEWMIDCARLLAHEGKGIEWTAPSGFPVVQRYTTTNFVRVETMLQGVRMRVAVPGSSHTISKEKQKNAISPNHTHSLDAAHLVFTVIKGNVEYGIDSFALIHDSFGTVAADTDDLFKAVREAFVEMYEQFDPFQHLYERVYEALSEEGRKKLKRPPVKGDLDLDQVRQSLYSFA